MSRRSTSTSLPRSMRIIFKIGFTRFFHSSVGSDIKYVKMHWKADKAVSRTSFPEPRLSASGHKSKNNKGHKTFARFPMRDCSTSGANEYFHSLLSHRLPHSSANTIPQSNRMLFGKTHVKSLRVRSCPRQLPDSCRHYLSLSPPVPIQPGDKHLHVHQIRGDWKWVHCIMQTEKRWVYLVYLRIPCFDITGGYPLPAHTDLLSFSPHLHSAISTNLRSHHHWRCVKAPFVRSLWSHCPPKPTPLALLSSPLNSIFLLRSHRSALQ